MKVKNSEIKTSGKSGGKYAGKTRRTYFVDSSSDNSSDANPGTLRLPFKTINAAAQRANPGDVIIVRGGVYRERVSPARGGKPAAEIVYQAAEGEKVFIRGSEEFRARWDNLHGSKNVLRASLSNINFASKAYHGYCDKSIYASFNPYYISFNKGLIARPHNKVIEEVKAKLEKCKNDLKELSEAEELRFSKACQRHSELEKELKSLTLKKNRKHRRTLGQLFVDGEPFTEIETIEELFEFPYTWMVSPDGKEIFANFAEANFNPKRHLIELSVRHTVFSPLKRGLGYISVKGFIIEHGANHFPTWDENGWPQVGLLSTRSGHHWRIEDNTIRYAKAIGLDCGKEGGQINIEFRGDDDYRKQHRNDIEDTGGCGWHLIKGNTISDNGLCGIAGIRHRGTKVLANIIERNNCDGWTSPWWEFAGIKFHFFFDGIIEGNLIRDNDTHGIWLDNQWKGSRVSRNLILNNMWSGINIELGRGPLLVDNNIIGLTRCGDGIYGHDCSDIKIAHNLIYGNANFACWFAYATPRIKPEDGCWDIKILNNIIAANRAGACALPLPWQCAGRNISDGNLFIGAGEYLDEGSGSKTPIFQITNCTHMANMPQHHPDGFEAQSPEKVKQKLLEKLKSSDLPEKLWPNLETWDEHYNVNFAVWQALGFDKNSKEMKSIRDILASRTLAFQMRFDETVFNISCEKISAVKKDFYGKRFGNKRIPGPFRDLEIGINRKVLNTIFKNKIKE